MNPAIYNAPINLLNLSTLPPELEHLGHLEIRRKKSSLIAFCLSASRFRILSPTCLPFREACFQRHAVGYRIDWSQYMDRLDLFHCPRRCAGYTASAVWFASN